MTTLRRTALAGIALTATVLTGCGGGDDGEGEDGSAIADAAEKCDPAKTDSGKSITFDYSDDSVTLRTSEATTESVLTWAVAAACIVEELDGPDSIGERLLTGVDGEETWDNYEANWSTTSTALFTIDAK